MAQTDDPAMAQLLLVSFLLAFLEEKECSGRASGAG